ncbi:MAG: TetR/AcrR family transcriptional regulator [Celeribacter sp.]|jgi:AcrR family transcriptional regulator
MDKRRRRTRLRLQAALRSLLTQKPLAEISVDALTRAAGVTRPTFYSNYADLTEMLDEYLTGLLAEMERRHIAIVDDPERGTPAMLSRFIEQALIDIDRTDPRLHTLLNGVTHLTPETRFAAMVEQMMARCDPIDRPFASDAARRLHPHFFTGAFVGMLRFWVSCPDGIDAAMMAAAFTQFGTSGRFGATAPLPGTPAP